MSVWPVFGASIAWDDVTVDIGDDPLARLLAGAVAADLDDVTPYTRGEPAITIKRGMDQVRILAPPKVSSMDSAELNNVSGIFSADDSSGPLYGLLNPGHQVQIRESYAGITYQLFTGVLDALPRHPEATRQSVGFPALGYMSQLQPIVSDVSLQQSGLYTPLYQSVRTDQALGYILDALGVPTSRRKFDVGATTLDWFWVNGDTPWQAAGKVLTSEGPGARLYEDGSGKIVFEGRHYRFQNARCTASQATLRTHGTSPWYIGPYAYDDGVKSVVNLAIATQTTRSAKASANITTPQAYTLLPHQSVTFIYMPSDPWTNIVATVSATDIQYSVTGGGQHVIVTITHQGVLTSSTITVPAATVAATGQPVTIDGSIQLQSQYNTTASQAKYGVRIYPFAPLPEISLFSLQDALDGIVYWWQNPRPKMSITLPDNADSATMVAALAAEISNRYTVVSPTGISADYYLESIMHKIGGQGFDQETTFGLESAASAGNFWTLGVSTLGVDTTVGF